VAFSPDGTRVVSGSLDKSIKLSDAETGALIRTIEGHSEKSHVGRILARRQPVAVGERLSLHIGVVVHRRLALLA
jgi:WD40 repeat protein